MCVAEDLHRLEIASVSEWTTVAADLLAAQIQEAIVARGRCLLAISGGSTPGPVFEELANRSLDWDRLVLLQADERLAARGSEQRNLTEQIRAFDGLPVTWLPLPADEIIDALAREDSATVVQSALADFAAQLYVHADDPPVIDIAQLGLGDDGHTASLFAGDAGLDELRLPVTLTGEYNGSRRLTLTRPVFDRARSVIWLVRGTTKVPALGRLLAGDLTLPAGLLRPARSVIVADTEAARQV